MKNGEQNLGDPPPQKKIKKIEKSELSEMARTLIEKSGDCRVLACADTGSKDPPWCAPVLNLFFNTFNSRF
jgi:hypothetical protein